MLADLRGVINAGGCMRETGECQQSSLLRVASIVWHLARMHNIWYMCYIRYKHKRG